jgi:hypothetical protein
MVSGSNYTIFRQLGKPVSAGFTIRPGNFSLKAFLNPSWSAKMVTLAT